MLLAVHISSQSVNYATSAGNADTVDNLHASNLVRFFLSPLASNGPADSAKSWFTGTMPSASGAIVYNVPGSEKTIIAGKSSGAYGHMLQLNYDDTYLRILRYKGGGWQSTDWEKISAGYADSAGSVSWSNVTSKPFNWSGQSGQPSWLWGSNDGTNYYVWNPSNFNVSSASTATALKQYFCTDSGNWNANNLSTVCAWYYGQSGGVSNHCGSYGGVFTIHNGSLNNSLSMQLGWDIIHNTSPGTGGLWFKGKNDLGWQQWKRVLDNTYYYVDSDRHLKKNISTIPASSLEHLFDISDKLLKKFTWKQTGKDSYGFIAQELEWYISEAVGFDKNNNIKTVDYNVAFTKLFAALIYKIKELEKKVNSSNH